VSKVKITVPATVTNIGPGLHVVGLALALHTNIEMSPRNDGKLSISMTGEGEDVVPVDFYNPVLKTATRVFQRFEMAPAGLNIHIDSEIPWDSGLGAQTALSIGGLVAANNLIDGNLRRSDIVQMACEMGLPATNVTAALMGALSICSEPAPGKIAYQTLDVVPLKLVVVVPYLPDYQGGQIGLPSLVALEDAVFNMGQTALMIEAMRTGNFELLASSMADRLHQPNYTAEIPGFKAVQEAALDSGAIALVVSGSGPAVLAVAEDFHESIADAIVDVFAEHEVAADTYIVGVDRQGITISITS
jgi:homoserine kinase